MMKTVQIEFKPTHNNIQPGIKKFSSQLALSLSISRLFRCNSNAKKTFQRTYLAWVYNAGKTHI